VIRRSIVIIITIFGLSVYAALLSSRNPGEILESAFRNISFQSGMAKYLQRFISSAILLGILPLFAVLLSRLSLRSVGIAKPAKYGKAYWFMLYIAMGIAIGVIGSLDPQLARFYPYHPRLVAAVAEGGAAKFVLHAVLYFVLYYIPWELTFRGVMVVAITEPMRPDSGKMPSILLLVAVLQAAPSAILHYGHPISEIIGAVFFGIAAGYLTVMSRSILPTLAIHASAGIALDLLIVMRGA
jgi:hypothetical protein